MADNARPSMYQAEYSAILANKPDTPPSQSVTIAGRFCESGDILIQNIDLPNPVENDIFYHFFQFHRVAANNPCQKSQSCYLLFSDAKIIFSLA